MDFPTIEIDYVGLVLTLGAILVGLIFLAVVIHKIKRFWRGRGFAATDRESLRRRWAEIEDLVKQPGELPKKMALLEADKMLDLALKSLSMPGETMGERLKYAAYKYPDIRDVWWAHKLRNQLAHEATFDLSTREAVGAVAQFKKTLQMLGAI